MSWRNGGRSCPGFESTRSIASRAMRAKRPSLTSSEDARSSLSTTSCSGPNTTRVPACSAIADGFDGFAVHLANHDVTLWRVAGAVREATGIQAENGMDVPGRPHSAMTSTTIQCLVHPGPAREEGIEYNYQRERLFAETARARRQTDPLSAAMAGTDVATSRVKAGHEHVRVRGWHRLPRLLRVRPRVGRPLGHLQ